MSSETKLRFGESLTGSVAMNADLTVDGFSSRVPKSTQSKEGSMRSAPNIKCALFVFVLVAGAVAAGCASTSRIEASASEIRAAGELGIAEVPQAAVHMGLAREQMKLAEKLAANEEWDQAESMLKRAQADADLALLLFQEEAEKSETMAAAKRRRLREQKEVPLEESNQLNERNIP
jgi:hypothetical protein